MLFRSDMWVIRFTTMCFSIVNSILIGLYARKHFKFVNFKATPTPSAIKGARAVLIQNITGVVYNSAPIVSISLSSGGTMLASVYAVYNSIFLMIKTVLRSVIDAPRLGLGELAAEKAKEHVWRVFQEYQLLVFYMTFVMLCVASVLITPFIMVYTRGVTDINYNQPVIAFLLALIAYAELMHIPSGHLINMTGLFKVSRNIQLIACLVLVVGIVIGSLTMGLVGILSSILLTALALAVLEIGYVHSRYFEKKLGAFFRLSLPFLLTAVPSIWLQSKFLPQIDGYVGLLLAGVVLVAINAVLGFALCYVFNKAGTINLAIRLKNMLLKRKASAQKGS